jgi:hypothetical protein
VGSYGLNTGAQRVSNPALTRPVYYSQPSSSRWTPPGSASGLSRGYWTNTAPTSRERIPSVYQPKTGGGYGAGAGGLVHDPLWAPLYTPLEPAASVQTAAGQVNLYSAAGLGLPRYRPVR